MIRLSSEAGPKREVEVQPRILVVDDEPAIVDLLLYNLQRANYAVTIARDGAEALRRAREVQPDLIILDLMLPAVDGLEVCRALRRERDVPIIMLTARDSEIDRVVGLELGADDYVVKPFSVRELMARVKNVLRRATGPRPPTSNGGHAQAGPLSIDPVRHEARLHGVGLDLTALEFDLLETLVRHEGQVLTREQLISQVWGYDYYGDVRVVDAAVKRLRSKLREAMQGDELIQTIRGVGYKLSV
jgi:two-component system response regulator VicR